MKRILGRAVILVVLLLVLGALGACVWFWHLGSSALPQVNGEIKVAGLTAPVSVVRDAQGVPHIAAATQADLFFAQGYVTAQDRLWQMDLSRRFAAGEISEILGQVGLKHDREQRILGIRQTVERSLAQFPADERARWDAYSAGVNAFIESHRDHLPIEFRVLRYQPKPWTAVDSLLCGANLVQALTHYQYSAALLREQVTAKLGATLAADLYPNSSWRDHPPGMIANSFETDPNAVEEHDDDVPDEQPARPARRARPHRQSFLQDRKVVPAVPAFVADALSAIEQLAAGSNNWVISGAHTVSGKPLLSNDMHLVNTVPNTWYEMHLTIRDSAPAYDVVGVTLPGLPYVIVGHNQRIAWGFTNLGATVEDVYIETVNDKGEYQAPDGWHPMARRHEVIHVKGTADVELDALATRHGPVITPNLPGETRTLALRWIIYEVPLNVPMFDLNTARNWDDFRAALAKFGTPSQNAVYADVDGHIGYQAMGRIPMRSADASLPVPGNDDAHEWTGFVPFDELPRVFDPPNGILATANGRVATDDYKYTLSYEWGPPFRTDRIYQVLRQNKKFTPSDMLTLETDIYSAFDKFCGDQFVYALDHAANASQRARDAANWMRGWDGRVSVDSRAAQVVISSRAEIWRMLLEPRLGPAPAAQPGVVNPPMGWRMYSWFNSTVAFEGLMTKRPQQWLPSGYNSWDDLIVAAVDKAVSESAGTAKWGDQHRIELKHPVFGALPIIGKWFGTGSHPLSGDGSTVKQIGGLLGPSERFTADFGNFDQSTLNIVTGQSGQILSPHWMDQWRAWYEGTTFPVAFSQSAVDAAAKSKLTLTP